MHKVCHLVDDTNIGGVMTALKNFDDPRLASIASHEQLVVKPDAQIAPRTRAAVILIHFTVSWSKIRFLTELRFRNQDAKIILVEHTYTEGFERWNVPNKFRFRTLLRLAYGLCDYVVAVSRGQASWLKGLDIDDKMIVIPQSRDLSGFLNSRSRCAPEDQKSVYKSLVFGAIGRFDRQKGFDQLITAFHSRTHKDSHLILGGFGTEEGALKTLAKNDPSIHFPGIISDQRAFYQSVNVVIVPSRWEAYGLVASEAMAAGKFVMVNNVDGLPEQIQGAGLFCNMDSVEMIRKQIDIVSSQYSIEDTNRIGAQAIALAQPRYATMINQWATLFKSCLRTLTED